MELWKLLVGEEEKVQVSKTRYADITLEEAIKCAENSYNSSKEISHGLSSNFQMNLANYHSLVAIGKRIGLPEEDSLVIDSNELYALSYEISHGLSSNSTIGRANLILSRAIDKYLCEKE